MKKNHNLKKITHTESKKMNMKNLKSRKLSTYAEGSSINQNKI